MVVNGVVIDDLSSAEESLLETLQEQLPKLQRAVYLGNVNDRTNVLGKFILIEWKDSIELNELNQYHIKKSKENRNCGNKL